MSYVRFEGLVKKVNLKPKGVQEIVLEISGGELQGQLENLSRMVDSQAIVELESMVVNYNIKINAATREPLTEYKVDNQGVVQEVKKPEQLELPGLPKEEVKTEEETMEVDKEAVDQFILNDMAPTYDDFPKGMVDIVKRRIEGESFSKLASELEISSGKIVEIIDEYCKRIAPLAAKWWEWKQKQGDTDTKEVENTDQKPDKKDGAA